MNLTSINYYISESYFLKLKNRNGFTTISEKLHNFFIPTNFNWYNFSATKNSSTIRVLSISTLVQKNNPGTRKTKFLPWILKLLQLPLPYFLDVKSSTLFTQGSRSYVHLPSCIYYITPNVSACRRSFRCRK